MTKESHPGEVLSDLHRVRALRPGFEELNFVFVGEWDNISNTWFEEAAKLDLNMTQACPKSYEINEELYAYARQSDQ